MQFIIAGGGGRILSSTQKPHLPAYRITTLILNGVPAVAPDRYCAKCGWEHPEGPAQDYSFPNRINGVAGCTVYDINFVCYRLNGDFPKRTIITHLGKGAAKVAVQSKGLVEYTNGSGKPSPVRSIRATGLRAQ